LLPSVYAQIRYVWRAMSEMQTLEATWTEGADHIHEVSTKKKTGGLEESLIDSRRDFKHCLATLKKEVKWLFYSGVALVLLAALFLYIIIWAGFKFVAVYSCPYNMWNWHIPISKGCVDLSQFACFAHPNFTFNSHCHSDNPCCNTSQH